MKHDMCKVQVYSYMNLFETTQSTSKYEGVSWDITRNLWQSKFCINGQKRKFYFDNEFDATKKINDFCDNMEIPPQNSQICDKPNQQVTHI